MSVTVPTNSPGLTVVLADEAHLNYFITGFNTEGNPALNTGEPLPEPVALTSLVFQSKRPVGGEVPDGITDDALAAILEHRLRAYSKSLASCGANTEALLHCQMMRGLLQRRNTTKYPIGQ